MVIQPQSRADGIPCRSAATDEVLKVQIIGTTDNGQPSGRFGVLVRESRTLPRTRNGLRDSHLIVLEAVNFGRTCAANGGREGGAAAGCARASHDPIHIGCFTRLPFN
ncbi:hypothetical protein EVAR_23001_1 [Eumeta japonica]|uniref:Uncharacterized protein n=1 Tax=Eumeta variegata TaxID=151549 RepID=A0A4C1URD3_EUMVA|nr:hypothetical protein EVAR_23001_1 [Eumeta japonica]